MKNLFLAVLVVSGQLGFSGFGFFAFGDGNGSPGYVEVGTW